MSSSISAFDGQLVLRQVIDEYFGHRHFWQDLAGFNAQPGVGSGKAIDEPLAAAAAEERFGKIVLWKLFWRYLGEARRLGDLQPNRAIVYHAIEPREPRRVLRPQLQRLKTLRKCVDRCLELDLNRKWSFCGWLS